MRIEVVIRPIDWHVEDKDVSSCIRTRAKSTPASFSVLRPLRFAAYDVSERTCHPSHADGMVICAVGSQQSNVDTALEVKDRI